MDIPNRYVRRSYENHYDKNAIPAKSGLFLRDARLSEQFCIGLRSSELEIGRLFADAKNYGFEGIYFPFLKLGQAYDVRSVAVALIKTAQEHGMPLICGIDTSDQKFVDNTKKILQSLDKSLILAFESYLNSLLQITSESTSNERLEIFKIPMSKIWNSQMGLNRIELRDFRAKLSLFLSSTEGSVKILTAESTKDVAELNLSSHNELDYFLLQEVYETVNDADRARFQSIAHINSEFETKSSYAVSLHLHFFEALKPIVEKLGEFVHSLDFIVSVTPNINKEQIELLKAQLPNLKIFPVENLGRDVLPFLRVIKSGALQNYMACCKLHSKQSAHNSTQNGLVWRDNLYTNLLRIKEFQSHIENASPETIMWTHPDNLRQIEEELEGPNPEKIKLLVASYPTGEQFIAGTMFWFRPNEFNQILPMQLLDKAFLEEPIPVDGTWAHALERYFSIVVRENGYSIGLVP